MFAIILIFFCKDITENALSLFQCVNVGDSEFQENRLIHEYGIDCSNSEYRFWVYVLAYPLLFFFSFSLPIFYLGYLIKLFWQKKDSKIKY